MISASFNFYYRFVFYTLVFSFLRSFPVRCGPQHLYNRSFYRQLHAKTLVTPSTLKVQPQNPHLHYAVRHMGKKAEKTADLRKSVRPFWGTEPSIVRSGNIRNQLAHRNTLRIKTRAARNAPGPLSRLLRRSALYLRTLDTKNVLLLFSKPIAMITSIRKRQQYYRDSKIEQHNTWNLPEYIISYLENIRIFCTLNYI